MEIYFAIFVLVSVSGFVVLSGRNYVLTLKIAEQDKLLLECSQVLQSNVIQQLENQKKLSTNKVSCWFVLGMMPSKDHKEVEKAFRQMSKVYHPDMGGDEKAFGVLTAAKEVALMKCQ